MAINYDSLTSTKDFVVFPADATVASIYGQLPKALKDRAYLYILVPVGNQYVVARWIEIEEIGRLSGYDITGVRIIDLAKLTVRSGYTPAGQALSLELAGLSLTTLLRRLQPADCADEQSTATQQAREARDTHPGKRLIVTSGGRIVCLLTVNLLSASTLGDSPIGQMMQPGSAVLGVGYNAPPRLPAPVLGTTTSPLEAAASAAPPPAPRVVNVHIADPESGVKLSKNMPLHLTATYDLKVSVGPEDELAIATATTQFIETAFAALPETQELLEVIVIFSSEDFTLYGVEYQSLIVPRVGRSKNHAVFTIEPKREGVGKITLTLSVNNIPAQQVVLSIPVDAAGAAVPASTLLPQTRGFPLETALGRSSRLALTTVNLIIEKQAQGYQFTLQGAGFKRVLLPIEVPAIADKIMTFRTSFLQQVINKFDSQTNLYPYTDQNTQIAPAIYQDTLKLFAQIGYDLYNFLFFASGAEDVTAMGELLRMFSQKRALNVQIVADRFVFPWSLLYDGDDPETTPVDPNGFWGFKHSIAYMPEFTASNLVSFVPEILVDDTVALGFVFDQTIDGQFKTTVIQDQRAALPRINGIRVREIGTKDDLFSVLKGTTPTPDLLYFYCHAVSRQPNEQVGPANAGIVGVDYSTVSVNGEAVSLLDLKAKTARAPKLSSAPLVFLNACQSAELSPYIYDGLVPYLVARGARGAWHRGEYAGLFRQRVRTRLSRSVLQR
jgi:hypothetical protein